jgi:signal transduction histidine kinase
VAHELRTPITLISGHAQRLLRQPGLEASAPSLRLIEQEADSAFKKPWHRLERGLRMNRIRAFVDDLAQKRAFKETEKQTLLSLLMKALDKKSLNSKTSVEYSAEEECIKEIKPLVMHESADGSILFQLLEKRNAVTFRKRGAGQEQQQQTQ